MTEPAVYLQPAFILQHRKYRETSLIIDVLTRDFGRVSLLAKGVRKAKSKTAGLLQPFIPLLISYFGKAELKTLTDVELQPASPIPGDNRACSRPAYGIHSVPGDIIQPLGELKGLALYCGFYVNELIGYFLHKYDPHPEVFDYYSRCLSRLSDGANIEAALREFELDLLQVVGYGLPLEYDVNDHPIGSFKKYDFNVGQGAVEALNGQFSGKALQALNARKLTDSQVLVEAKILMRMVIDVYLQGKQLKSRAVINEIIKHTSAERDL
ncbi:DNA repair protein RecO [Candidatus Methylobacter oryzae]|uniref:DNA repair protein RecO n=1 Tax=Candidatus Methylobacter oryzae TaxID=2497749 RepID=A0ABY3C8I2_9GAMM|nr:DNA repair protein RecO [Candidatus Methylobacter oryzae]TRW92113.1 DNA repair protein RecO [Candidatus Methylobacter oryzae]